MKDSGIISARTVAALSETERLYLYLFAFEGSEREICDFGLPMRTRFGVKMTAQASDQLCRILVTRGILRCTSNGVAVATRRYVLASRLSFGAAKALIAAAKENGWLPLRGSGIRMLASLIDGGRGFSEELGRSYGGGSGDFYYCHDSGNGPLWYAAIGLADMMDVQDALPSINLPDGTNDRVYRILSSVLFCRGFDVAPLLLDWHRKHMKSGWGRGCAEHDAAEYAALCFWTGRLDLLDVFGKSVNAGVVDEFVSACAAASKGDMETAYKYTAGVADIVTRETRDYEETLLSTPACHLFALAVSVFHKPAKTRVSKLALKLCPLKSSFKYELPDSARQYFESKMQESADLIGFLDGWHMEYPSSSGLWLSPTCRVGKVFSAIASRMGRSAMENYAPTALSLAEWAVKAGYPSVASMYISAFGWAFRGEAAAKSKALAGAITKAGGTWFRPYEDETGEWKFIVEAFDKVLPAADRIAAERPESKARSGRIVWAVRLANVGGAADDAVNARPQPGCVCRCVAITPHFRGPRSPDDGTSDRPLTGKAFLSGKYDGIMTEVDRSVADELRKADCLRKCLKEPPAAAVAALCGHDCVTISRRAGRNQLEVCEAASFVRRDLPLAVKSLPDGGLSIAVEPWCQLVNGDHAIRPLPDGAFAFYAFSKTARATLEVFKMFGKNNGTIEIPKAGMEAMRPLLPRMAALAPIQGELSAVGGGADLERIPGDATPLFRLSFEDGVLVISLLAKPLEGSELVFVPGAGQPERMVAHKGHTAVLVRDLDAERAAAAKARDALGEFESWSNGENVWRIDDLVYSLKALSALKDLGDAVRLEWRKGPRISLTAPKPGSCRLSAVGGADFWFSVSGDFKLDDGRALELSELIAAFRNRRGEFVPLGENAFLRLTASLLRRLEALEAAGRTKGKGLEVPPAAMPMLDAVFAAGGDGDLALPAAMEERAEAVRAAFARRIEPPSRLKAELRPYQREGYEWLSRLAACQMGACLADDMGLGKTVQVIALLLERSKDGASLVVAPASVCGNWRSEIARFAPTLRSVMAWDEKSDSMNAVTAAGPGDVVIAGYGLLVSRAAQFAAREWNGVVLDEAQAIKNEASKRARAAKRLVAKFRVAATGTPVENRLQELWSISDFLNPGLLGTSGDFARRFTVNGRATPALKRLVSPLVLRRVKRDVLEDLPEKTEITMPVELGEEERAGYETCRRMALDALAAGGADNRFSILAELTRLRRYCCHPSLVIGEAGRVSAKMDALLELLGNLRDNGHRALVFSQFTDYLAIVRREIDAQGWTHCYLDGQTPAAERARLVDDFQRGEGDFFLISLKAGGTGLNLTAANYVILLDPWWNPAVENQAADRAHRIGQRNPVTVYRLIAADTVEERVVELHREKKALAEDVLGGAGSAALTPEQLMGLFR